MKKLMVATDLSTRSDRALRRAALLARQFDAQLTIVHVIDDDLPRRLQKVAQRESEALLLDICDSTRAVDGVKCDILVELGDPFAMVLQSAQALKADLVVMGSHRRQILRDIFIGTTVERTIRESRRPVLMVNAMPAKPYERAILATDFSPVSVQAARAASRLRFLGARSVAVLHAYQAPAQGLMRRAGVRPDQMEDYLGDERDSTEAAMQGFVAKSKIEASKSVLRIIETSPAQAILAGAREEGSQLVVVGTHGLTGASRVLIGSVAEAVLKDAEMDVLTIPRAVPAKQARAGTRRSRANGRRSDRQSGTA